MKKYFILLILALPSLQNFGQGVPAYNRYPDPFYPSMYFEGNSTSDVVQLQNSDLLLTGAIHKIPALIHTDLNGVRKSAKVMYTSGLSFSLTQIILYDPSTIFMLGNFGYSQNGIVLIKADTAGNVYWAKKLVKWTGTTAISMIRTYDSKLVIYGYDSSGILLVKMDTTGSVVWSKGYYSGYIPPSLPIPYGGYVYDGPGNIIELPNHCITIGTTTQQTYGNSVYTPYSNAGAAATIIKTDSNGNLLWAKKLQPMPPSPPYNFQTYPSFTTGIGDIFYGSDNNYILSMYGNYVAKMDSNANPINGNSFGGEYQL